MATDLFILTGEASGDVLGAALIKALKAEQPNLQIAAVGADHMRNTGVDIILDSKELCFMGIVEVLKNLGTIKKNLNLISQWLEANQPRCIVLVDFYGFNSKIARIAKLLGIKVIWYVSPKFWAWNYKRVHKLKALVDHMLVLFPFEQVLCAQEGIPTTYVGHPLVDVAQHNVPFSDDELRAHGIHSNNPVVLVMPGSRKQEIHHLLPTFIAACQLLQNDNTNLQFVLPKANTLPMNLFASAGDAGIKVIDCDASKLIPHCRAGMICSGTATFEVALYSVPEVICYKMPRITYWIGRLLVKVSMIGLCNIIAGRKFAPELIQDAATPGTIASHIKALLEDGPVRSEQLHAMQNMQRIMGNSDCAKQAANIVLEFLA